MVGVPGPIDLRTEIRIPDGTFIPPETVGKIVLHNDPAIDATKAWPWSSVSRFIQAVGPTGVEHPTRCKGGIERGPLSEPVVLLGNPGPAGAGTIDLRGRTTLAQAAAIIAAAKCYVGIDSGLMWIAGSVQAPVVGLYGTSYIAAYKAIHPHNPNAVYLQVDGALDQIPVEAVLDHLPQGAL